MRVTCCQITTLKLGNFKWVMIDVNESVEDGYKEIYSIFNSGAEQLIMLTIYL